MAQRAGNNQQWRTIGALNALTGQVNYLDGYIVGRQQVIAFYTQLNRAYPTVDLLYVIQDNWNIHTHPDVMTALAKYPRIKPVWLPTYAPWLNPIEKLWRWVRQDILKMHRWVEDWLGEPGVDRTGPLAQVELREEFPVHRFQGGQDLAHLFAGVACHATERLHFVEAATPLEPGRFRLI